MDNVLLFAFLFAITIFIVTMIFQLNMFRVTQDRKFNFKNELPFELTEGVPRKFLRLQYLLHGVISVALLVFGFAFVFKDTSDLFFYDYLLLAGLTLSAFTYFLVFFLKLDEVKFHLIILLLYVFSLFTAYLAFALYLHLSPYSPLLNNKATYVFIVFGYLVSLVMLLLMFNPQLAKWPVMDKIKQQDETLIILRPKLFILAVYEWLFVLLHFIFLIIVILTLFL